MEKRKAGIFIVLVTFVFLASCAKRVVIYNPDVFETGNTLLKKQWSVGGSLGGQINSYDISSVVFPLLPDISGNLAYGISDWLTVRGRGSVGLIAAGTVTRLGASATAKFLDIGFLRSSLSAGMGYLSSRTEASNIVEGKVKAGYDSFYGLTTLNLGLYPFRKIFCVYGNFGFDGVTGKLVMGNAPFDSFNWIAGGGLAFELETLDVKIGFCVPVINNNSGGVTLANQNILFYVPNVGIEFNMKIGGDDSNGE